MKNKKNKNRIKTQRSKYLGGQEDCFKDKCFTDSNAATK